MKAVAERIEKNKVNLEIEVDAEKVDAALERAYRKVVRQVNIPGFRKGKVPRVIIEKRFGKEVLYEEALEELIPQAYREAVISNELEPIDEPTVTEVDIEQGKPLRFTAVVEVIPEVTLGEYKGVSVEKLVEQVESKDIDHMLDHLREEHAQLETTDRTVTETGDFVTIDFEGFIDGVPFEGGAAKGFTLELGSGRFIPGFEDQLTGVGLGEVEVNVSFPEDYGNELAGKDALFRVDVKEIKVKRLPELDDEFVASNTDAKTLLELRAKIREDMEKQAERRAEQEMRQKLVDAVCDGSEVDIPPVMIERQVEAIIQEFAQNLAFQGIALDAFLEQSNQTRADLEEEARSVAEQRVKRDLVLSALAKSEGITVSEDELEAKISELVEESQHPDSMRDWMNDPNQREDFRSRLLVEKTIAFLVEHADITEKEIPSAGHGHHHD